MSGFMRGELCQSYLSRFLHEGAHHSCFDTRLGAALASVELHARQLGFTKTGCSHGSLDNATRGAGVGCHNRAVFNAALELLRPILEGIALRMELDVLPGGASSVSFAMLRAVPVFFGAEARSRQLSNDEELWASFSVWLAGIRSDSGSGFEQTRKALRSEELRAQAPWYLDGYKLISALEANAAASDACPSDSDAVLNFLVSYFGRDPRFAALLCSCAKTNPLTPNAGASFSSVVDYLVGRVRLLFSSDIGGWVAEFNRAVSAGVPIESCSFFDHDERDFGVVRSALSYLGVGELNIWSPPVLQHRHVFRFGIVALDAIDCDWAAGRVLGHSGSWSFECELLEGGRPVGETESRKAAWPDTQLELVFVGSIPIACVFVDGHLVAAFDQAGSTIHPTFAERWLGAISPVGRHREWSRDQFEGLNPGEKGPCADYHSAMLEVATSGVDALRGLVG